ncbi:MAG: efflux RND transporter permease subunit [Hyphomicrobiaceae bacterium]
MNFSAPFISRPIGTALLAAGLLLVGIVAWLNLPVASLPSVELPTIRVSASRPGADPSTMAATIAAPLERRLGAIPGVTELTSVNSLGSTGITVQFDLSRDIVGAARDVQAALNGAVADLPGDLPTLPQFRKMNPAAAPILILAMTSDTVKPSEIYDAADTVVAQRIMQVEGVADVSVNGAEQPAVRVRVNPLKLAAMGLSLDRIRSTIAEANANAPVGIMQGERQAVAIAVNDQLRTPEDYRNLVIRTASGQPVRLGDVASVDESTRNTRSIATYNGRPAVLLVITKEATGNVIETVDRVLDLIPEIKRWIPEGINVEVLSDRTGTIRASVADMEHTLVIAIALVMLVVFAFLRRLAPTMAAGITVPLSLAGTAAAMWAAGFSIDNLSLMALAVSVGFVVDDAIVMIENVFRNLEEGKSPMRAALDGARQIGFTIISISVSLLAAFIPLFFMDGIFGRFLSEFSLTLAFAIISSTIVSLSVTAMICAHFIKRPPSADETLFDRVMERSLSGIVRAYARTLSVTLRHNGLMLVVMLLTVGLTVALFVKSPKGFIPQDDTGLMFGGMRASPEISFDSMVALQQQAVDIVRSDPAVAGVGASVGGGRSSTVNRGRMFISLKPRAERGGISTQDVASRLRRRLARIEGLRVFVSPARDIRAGGRQSDSDYQITLWGTDIDQIQDWVPKVSDAIRSVPGVTDVSTDREQGGLEARVSINRQEAARLGVSSQDISTALNNAFAQRQISVIYQPRNQYRVVMEVEPRFSRDPGDLQHIYVTSHDGAQVPLAAVTRIERTNSPLVINHQGQFPAVTVSYSLEPNAKLDEATTQIMQAIAELHPPNGLHIDPAGDLKAFQAQSGSQALLIIAALIAVYIVLGVLYESLAHPLTIISTLPSAGLGALIALQFAGMEVSVIALIGIVLLIGIVKKNGIMMVDFALEGERKRGLSSERAIYEACIARFRPILMTTLAAALGALPLALGTGPGSELRRPLGVAIIGGMLVSQLLTLYTTPAVYILLDRLHRRISGKRKPAAPAEIPDTAAAAGAP